jgi:sugar lactone lactonase YvrE
MKYLMKYFAVFFVLTALSVSIYPQVPLSNFMSAVGVLGTTDFVTNTNYLEPPTSASLGEPFCVAVDLATGKLFVADRDNRRVLRFSSANKLINGAAAEVVLGQPDFVTRSANTGGISAATMNNPNSVYVDATGTLWVADRDNNRILRFNNASTKLSGANADGVLGQPDFVSSTAGTTAGLMSAPASVSVDGSGRLWVADRANNRVLRFDNASTKANGSNTDGVLGQSDFVTGTSGLTATTMNAPWGVYIDVAGRLWVAERNNNRVTRFDNAAGLANGAAANAVLGQPDFVTALSGLTQSQFNGPRGAFMDGLGRLFVGDEGNSRVIVFTNAAAKTNGANADYVLGQPDFITSVGSVTNASSLNYPSTIFIENANNHIWIPDTYSHRILRYDIIPLPVELTSFTAIAHNQQVALNWRTATENNNKGFEIQRKVDDNNWIVIAFKNGNGTTTNPNNYSFADNISSLNANKLSYRLRQIDFNGQSQFSSVVLVDNTIPVNYTVSQNFPNPFNPSTIIKYQVPQNSFVSLRVYNSLGQEAATLVNGMANAGNYEVHFNASNLSSGVYYYIIKAGDNFVQIKKMILIK